MSSLVPTTPDALVRPNASIVSPLRYPGSKRRLVGYVAQALALSGIKPDLLVEPFAGGASVALQLLASDAVERAVLGEKDPLVASFWQTVFDDPEYLCTEIRKWTPTVDAWQTLRDSTPRAPHRQARKCLFLNRTSFSGVIANTAGPIGGRAQTSDYGIGCRFPKERLQKRICQASLLGPRVPLVHLGDWQDTIDAALELAEPGRAFVYLDPPFYRKADRLYRHFFDIAEHVRLADGVASLAARGVPFLLSYDAADEIAELYRDRDLPLSRVEFIYSATAKGGPAPAAELVVSNLTLPDVSRIWRTQAEWLTRGDGQSSAVPSVHVDAPQGR